VKLCTLCGINDVPSFLECHDCWDFACYMLALVHGVDHHLSVMLPVGSDVDEIDIVTIAELLPSIFTSAIGSCCREPCFREELLSLLYTLGVQVTKSLDLYTIKMCESLHSTRTTHPETNEPYTYDLHGLVAKCKHILLTLRADGDIRFDYVVARRLGDIFTLALLCT